HPRGLRTDPRAGDPAPGRRHRRFPAPAPALLTVCIAAAAAPARLTGLAPPGLRDGQAPTTPDGVGDVNHVVDDVVPHRLLVGCHLAVQVDAEQPDARAD